MPDEQIDRVIRSVEANKGVLTNVLAKEVPALKHDGVWEAIVGAMKEAFQDDDAIVKYRPAR